MKTESVINEVMGILYKFWFFYEWNFYELNFSIMTFIDYSKKIHKTIQQGSSIFHDAKYTKKKKK